MWPAQVFLFGSSVAPVAPVEPVAPVAPVVSGAVLSACSSDGASTATATAVTSTPSAAAMRRRAGSGLNNLASWGLSVVGEGGAPQRAVRSVAQTGYSRPS